MKKVDGFEVAKTMTCPYCGGAVQFVDSARVYGQGRSYGMIYLCSNYPTCRSWVGCHNDDRPLGSLADAETRKARKQAHDIFDRLWKDGTLKRGQAYYYLAQHLGVKEVHIGQSDVETCKRIVRFAMMMLGIDGQAADLPSCPYCGNQDVEWKGEQPLGKLVLNLYSCSRPGCPGNQTSFTTPRRELDAPGN